MVNFKGVWKEVRSSAGCIISVAEQFTSSGVDVRIVLTSGMYFELCLTFIRKVRFSH